jgi:hypothetical protein
MGEKKKAKAAKQKSQLGRAHEVHNALIQVSSYIHTEDIMLKISVIRLINLLGIVSIMLMRRVFPYSKKL